MVPVSDDHDLVQEVTKSSRLEEGAEREATDVDAVAPQGEGAEVGALSCRQGS